MQKQEDFYFFSRNAWLQSFPDVPDRQGLMQPFVTSSSSSSSICIIFFGPRHDAFKKNVALKPLLTGGLRFRF